MCRCASSCCDLDLTFDLAVVTLTYKILLFLGFHKVYKVGTWLGGVCKCMCASWCDLFALHGCMQYHFYSMGNIHTFFADPFFCFSPHLQPFLLLCGSVPVRGSCKGATHRGSCVSLRCHICRMPSHCRTPTTSILSVSHCRTMTANGVTSSNPFIKKSLILCMVHMRARQAYDTLSIVSAAQPSPSQASWHCSWTNKHIFTISVTFSKLYFLRFLSMSQSHLIIS